MDILPSECHLLLHTMPSLPVVSLSASVLYASLVFASSFLCDCIRVPVHPARPSGGLHATTTGDANVRCTSECGRSAKLVAGLAVGLSAASLGAAATSDEKPRSQKDGTVTKLRYYIALAQMLAAEG